MAEPPQLSQHRADGAHLQEQPLQRFEALRRIMRQQPAMLLREMQQDGTGLEDAQLARVVGQRRNLVVRTDGEEVRRKLRTGGEIHVDALVIEFQFFQRDADFLPIGRIGEINGIHGLAGSE